MHFEFRERSHFLKNYRKVLTENGFNDDEKVNKLIMQIEDEVARRRKLSFDSLQRRKIIKEIYLPLHPEIYVLKESFLSPEFLELFYYCKDADSSFEGVFDFLEELDRVSRSYIIPVFTSEFCKLFLEEIHHFEQSDAPKGRPNTMNKYGVLLNELGFDPFFTVLREKYLMPVTSLLYPDIGGGELDSHKVFVVQYKVGEDIDLSYHYDNAEVTLNIALSPKDSYKGGNLYFGCMRTDLPVDSYKEIEHKPTAGILHRGQHMHGAAPITSGERFNLILWMRASIVRNKKCPMCDNVPELVETAGFGDGFTDPETVDICSAV